MSSDMMKGLEGVLLKADDILVVRETFEEAEKDHDAKLKGFMEYCGEKNYKLHKDEPRFKKRKFKYHGQILYRRDQIGPLEDMVESDCSIQDVFLCTTSQNQ